MLINPSFSLIRSEWKKILSGNFGAPLTIKMIESGLAKYIGLPEDPNCHRMKETWSTITVSGEFSRFFVKKYTDD
jgi:hypothetical protein